MYKMMKKIILLSGIALLTGCMMPKMQLENLSELKPDEVIYIGKITFDPHIRKDEIKYKNVINLGGDDMHKTLYFKMSDVYYDLEGHHGTDIKSSVAGREGEPYYFSWGKDKPLYLLGVSFITHWSSARREFMTWTIGKGIKIENPAGSRAVYVGDITIKRDEFWNIKDVKISQANFARAKADFRKKYGTKMEVSRARLKPGRE